MKIAIQCDSPLLQRSLELFLEGQITTVPHCDVVIRDKEIIDDRYTTFVIGSDIPKPFSKEQLLEGLENVYARMHRISDDTIVTEMSKPMSFESLEQRIEALTREYQTNLLTTIRAFYEQ